MGISCCCFKNCQSKGSVSSSELVKMKQKSNNPVILSSGYRCQRDPNKVQWNSRVAAELQGWTIFFSIWLLFTARTLCCERRHNHLRMKWRNQKKANNVQVDHWYTDINAALWLEWFLLRAVFIHMHLFFFYTSHRHSRMIMLVWRTNVWIWPLVMSQLERLLVNLINSNKFNAHNYLLAEWTFSYELIGAHECVDHR